MESVSFSQMLCAIIHLILFLLWVGVFGVKLPELAFGSAMVLMISMISSIAYYARRSKGLAKA
jgi:hypothetical protein